LGAYFILVVLVFVLLEGCTAAEPINRLEESIPPVPASVQHTIEPDIFLLETNTTTTSQPTATVMKQNETALSQENYSVPVEVDYRKYVDWFMEYNIHIRGYTQDEYVCGQYTVDMINASKNAGFKAYFGAVRFSEDMGHALVAFKSTHFEITSWYFFEPQTNNQMNPQTIKEVLQEKLGKTVTEVTVYGYYDDAGDKDPTTWRFAYPLYNKKY